MGSDHRGKQKILASLPSVDELLKAREGHKWLSDHPRRIVVESIREIIELTRKEIISGRSTKVDMDGIVCAIEGRIAERSSFSLRPVINATGIVIHTNLGRSGLSEKALANVLAVSRGYSNLEYDIAAGARGKRHVHTTGLLRELTGAEDAFIVNNNAAAVLLCLRSLAFGREVVVSRSELVEIGGSFRLPDVMAAGGAILREVGTTNKTHLHDYERVLGPETAVILKVHRSNFRITGFTEEVGIEGLVELGAKMQIPIMYDLGSGCILDLKPFGISGEPTVREIVAAGADVVTFSGDKLLGGPQGGVIVGKSQLIEKIRKDPLARAVRVDKMTIAAFEAVLMEYMDPDAAIGSLPTLGLLLQKPEEIRRKAARIASSLRKLPADASIAVVSDVSMAGGGSLPETPFHTFAVAIRPGHISVNELEQRLRKGRPSVIGRIKNDALLLDARTVRPGEIRALVSAAAAALAARG